MLADANLIGKRAIVHLTIEGGPAETGAFQNRTYAQNSFGLGHNNLPLSSVNRFVPAHAKSMMTDMAGQRIAADGGAQQHMTAYIWMCLGGRKFFRKNCCEGSFVSLLAEMVSKREAGYRGLGYRIVDDVGPGL